MLKPYKILSKEEVSSLRLISKSKNGAYKPIYKEELPRVLYGHSPRQLLGYKWFNTYTKDLDSVRVCQGCGKILTGAGERHELYSLNFIDSEDIKGYIIKLEGVMKVCGRCHKAIHYGFSTRLGMKYGSLPDRFPESRALVTGPWGKAKYLLVDNHLYSL